MTENELKILIGNNIKKYRKEKGLTQKELANLVKVATPLIGSLESKNIIQGISIYNLYKISMVLEVPVNKFFEELKIALS